MKKIFTLTLAIMTGIEITFAGQSKISNASNDIEVVKEMTPGVGFLTWVESDQQWGLTVYDKGENPGFVFVLGVAGNADVYPTTVTLTNSEDYSFLFSEIPEDESLDPEFGGIVYNAALSIQYDGNGIKNLDGNYYMLGKISGEMNDEFGFKLIVNEPADFIKIFVPTPPSTGIDQTTGDRKSTVSKTIQNGKIYILRGNKAYTLTGQEVK